MKHPLRACLAMLLMLSVRAGAAHITDMQGRSVTVSNHISRVLGASPPITYLLYTLDPALLAGLNSAPDDDLRRYLRADTMRLPVVGGFAGQGKKFNAEVILATRPDLVLAWAPRSATLPPRVEQILTSSGIPFAYVRLDRLADYPAAYEFLGSLLGRWERGKKLAEYFRSELKKMERFAARIPENGRVRVYFAEEMDGLTTVSSGSVHGEAVALAGGRNVHRNGSAGGRVKDRISIEQVVAYNPEVIIAQDESFFSGIYRDPRWAQIRAVRDRRVYLIPDTPFDWMDRPPSFLRLMGAKWLAGVLYPKTAGINIVADTRSFFRQFFGVSLDDGEIHAILYK